MTIKRRLNDLEGRSPLRPRSRKSSPAVPVSPSPAELEASIRRKLSLPLPSSATSDEIARTIALLKTAVLRLKSNSSDTAGFDAVQAVAESIHEKYRVE